MESLTEQEIKQYIDLKRKIENNAEEIADIFDYRRVKLFPGKGHLSRFSIATNRPEKEDEITISLALLYKGENFAEKYIYPLCYLFKSTNELKEIKRIKDEEHKKKICEDEEKRKIEDKERRRRMYLKLKEEFEGEK